MISTGAPLWIDLTMLLAGLIGVFEGGRWIGDVLLARSGGGEADDGAEKSGGDNHSLSGVFGLLALLLAFSFGMALDRFDQRRTLVVAEANALSTLASRVELLPSDDAQAIRILLATYGQQRLDFGAASADADSIAASERAEQTHAAIGQAIYASLARSAPDPRGPALLQSYNDASDVAAERRAAREGHLPPTVLLLLAVFSAAGAAMLGYSRAGTRLVHRPAAYLFLGMLSFAYTAILDIDRPRDGSIRVPQLAMERQVAALQEQAAVDR